MSATGHKSVTIIYYPVLEWLPILYALRLNVSIVCNIVGGQA